VNSLGRQLAGIIAVAARRAIEVGKGCTTFELFQVIENRLFDQPVGSPVNGLRRRFQSLAGRVV
jgi:hypothetical protein